MQNIKLLGIPFDLGQEHPGVKEAAAFLRNLGLISRLQKFSSVEDLGDLTFSAEQGVKHLRQAFLGNELISKRILDTNLEQSFLLSIGGDHGMALGSIHGILGHRPETVVVWADAHGDINTPETSPSGNFHGMPLAFLLKVARHPEIEWIKNFLLPQKLILIGPRDLDRGEKEIIERLHIEYFSSDDLNRMGSQEVLEMGLNKVDPLGTSPLHLSFDVDVFDHDDVLSTGTKVRGGPRIEEIFLMGGILAQTGRLKSMDVVELNPQIGTSDAALSSGELVMDFIEQTLQQVFLIKPLNECAHHLNTMVLENFF